jgi:hypothetical protein
MPQEGFVVVGGECRGEGENDPGPCKEMQGGIIVDLPDGTPCDDSDLCTLGTICRGGVCTEGSPLQCPDSDSVTTDWCSPLSGCLHEAECDEFRVNAVTEGSQLSVQTISFPGGGGVIVWQRDHSFDDKVRISFLLLSDGIGPTHDEVEVLPLAHVNQDYANRAGFRGAVRVGVDRFVVCWDLGTQGQGFYRIYDRNGTPVTDTLVFPDLLSYRLMARDPEGFLMLNYTSPGGPDQEWYFYRFDTEGRLQAGPVEADLSGNYHRILSREDGTFQVFYSNIDGIQVKKYYSSTLLPVSGSETIAVPERGQVTGVQPTPRGLVMAVYRAYLGAWLYWLDHDGNLVDTTTLATIDGDSPPPLGVGLATWSDGRTFAAVANYGNPNGMALYRFIETNRHHRE